MAPKYPVVFFKDLNPEIKQLYLDFYGKPLSELAEKMLHTAYISRAGDLKQGTKKDVPCNTLTKGTPIPESLHATRHVQNI